MINLLPADKKAEIRAARTNTIISRYAAIVFAAALFSAGVLYVSYTLLAKTMESAKNRVDTTAAQVNGLGATSAEAQALGAKLSEGKQVLDQGVQYSKVLTSLGQAMPSNTILDSVEFTENSFSGTPTSLRIYAKSASDTAAITQNLQASQVITQVTVQSTDPSAGIDGYPVRVTLSGVFVKTGML